MLRLLVLLLLLANGGYFAWTQGWLGGLGIAPGAQAEPQRLAQQINPQALRVLSADEERRRASTTAAAPKAGECLQAGLFDEPQSTALREALAPLPVGSWRLEAATAPARWIVYMGRYADADMVVRKKAELRQRNVRYETLANPTLEPGLSLGGFDSQAEANQQLSALASHGVRTARVVQERPEVQGQRLVLPAADDALRARLDEFKAPLAGKPLKPCA